MDSGLRQRNIQTSDVREFQRELNNDEDEKMHFVESTIPDSSSESDHDEVRIVAPRRRKKKGHIDTMLMEQLLLQQKACMKAQKKIYELQTEIDTEEIKTRYIKLDLNNAQVKANEEKEKRQNMKKELFRSRVENWVTRVLIILYILYSLYSFVVSPYYY